MSIVNLFKGMLLSGGFVATVAALERVAPEVLPEDVAAENSQGLPQDDEARGADFTETDCVLLLKSAMDNTGTL